MVLLPADQQQGTQSQQQDSQQQQQQQQQQGTAKEDPGLAYFRDNIYLPVIYNPNAKSNNRPVCFDCHGANGREPVFALTDPAASMQKVLGLVNFALPSTSKFVEKAGEGFPLHCNASCNSTLREYVLSKIGPWKAAIDSAKDTGGGTVNPIFEYTTTEITLGSGSDLSWTTNHGTVEAKIVSVGSNLEIRRLRWTTPQSSHIFVKGIWLVADTQTLLSASATAFSKVSRVMPSGSSTTLSIKSAFIPSNTKKLALGIEDVGIASSSQTACRAQSAFDTNVWPVLNTAITLPGMSLKCTGCHNGGNTSYPTALGRFSMTGSLSLICFRALARTDEVVNDAVFPQVPINSLFDHPTGITLTNTQKSAIESWITQEKSLD